MRFGEAAVELGLLTPGQLDDLLRLQRRQTTPLETLLVKAGAFDDAAARALRDA